MFEFWDLIQQGQIGHAAGNAEAARRDSAQTSDRLHAEVIRLERKIDGLALISQAMWELLREKTALSDDDIRTRIQEIDLRDGRADGRMSGGPTKCPKCNRPGHTRQRVCAYCSTPFAEGHVMEKPPAGN